jgi:hypothetical protein
MRVTTSEFLRFGHRRRPIKIGHWPMKVWWHREHPIAHTPRGLNRGGGIHAKTYVERRVGRA